MEYTTTKLKTRIVERFGNQKNFAEAMGMSEGTLSRYLAGDNEWKASTMIKAAELLEIPGDAVAAYFFETSVSKGKPEGAEP
jgi:transcriptional regulator with XRE-family HTH domain